MLRCGVPVHPHRGGGIRDGLVDREGENVHSRVPRPPSDMIPILGNREALKTSLTPLLYRMKEKCLRFRFNIQYLTRNINDAPDCMFRKYGDGEDEETRAVKRRRPGDPGS